MAVMTLRDHLGGASMICTRRRVTDRVALNG
jgi:hypothetical protein